MSLLFRLLRPVIEAEVERRVAERDPFDQLAWVSASPEVQFWGNIRPENFIEWETGSFLGQWRAREEPDDV